MKFTWDAKALKSGDERYLATIISRVQDNPESCSDFLPEIYQMGKKAHQNGARIYGITGPPGGGKSTLLARLLEEIQSQSVGVLLIDPSSPFSGGALLGDRLRLQGNIPASHFVRSLGTRGRHGGLCRAARDIVRLLLAAGKKHLFVETVGVGQTETEIMELADVTALVLTPGSGDVIQTLKAGVMEIADIFVINKSDREGAAQLVGDIHALDSEAAIIQTIATQGQGVRELWQQLLQPERSNTQRKKSVRESLIAEICQNLSDTIVHKIRAALQEDPKWQSQLQAIERGNFDPYSLARDLLKVDWK